MKLEFLNRSARDGDNPQANTSRLVNLYLEGSGGKTQNTLKSVLGTTPFAIAPGLFARAMAEVGDMIYMACGGRLYSVSPAGQVIDLGAVSDDASATISGNNGDVTLCIGGIYYIWDGANLTTPSAGAFSDFGSLDYINNYTILTQKSGRMFQWSDIADASNLPGLNFSTADGRDDNIIRCAAINGVLYIFKESSHEVWYVTGAAGADAFERQAGGVVDVGIKAFGLLAKISTGGAFFVGDDGKAYIIGIGPVSTPPVETAIEKYRPEKCIYYEDEGHSFCAIIFRDAPAWVYDISTGEWHERASGVNLGPWQASVSAKMLGKWFIGRDGGDILEMGRTNTDGAISLARVAVSNTLDFEGVERTLAEIEVFAKTGFEAGTIELRLSRDSGNTWTDPKPKSWAIGEYGRRILWQALGSSRQITAELRMTDPIDVPINSTVRVRL